jgi:hypothetical protein
MQEALTDPFPGSAAMPFALVILLLDITLVYHASRTGRMQPWAFIILMVPLFGAIAYICVEVIPEWFSSPGARQARSGLPTSLIRTSSTVSCPTGWPAAIPSPTVRIWRPNA